MKLHISQITLRDDIYPDRVAACKEYIRKYETDRRAIKPNGERALFLEMAWELPEVCAEDGTYKVVNGNHRITAQIEMGREMIEVNI